MWKLVDPCRSAVASLALATTVGVATICAVAPAAADGPTLRSAYGVLPKSNHHRGRLLQHTSRLRITERDKLPMSRAITLGASKSVLVEVPRTLKDVLVSDPEIVDAVVQTSNRVYLIGKKIGQANAFFFDEFGEQIITLELLVEADMRPLDRLLNRLLPGSQIVAEALNDTIVLTGSVRTPADSNAATQIAARFAVRSEPAADTTTQNKVVNMLRVEGEEQVMLRVQVTEVARTLMKQFGINLGAGLSAGDFGVSLLTDNALPITAAAGLGTLPTPGIFTDPDTGVSSIANFNSGPTFDGATVFGNSGVTSTFSNSSATVTKAFRALERAGLVKTLAEPNLTAISGEAARFLAGGEFPVPVVDNDGGLGVEFKQFGVGLSFTPTVLSGGRISLKLETEVSELSTEAAVTLGGISIPGLSKRTATTTVELPSGGSLALAGLVSKATRQNIDGFPGLKDLPVLGTLFRSKDFVQEETELMIIVTPFLVRPTARRNLTGVGKGLHPATDKKATFLGQLNRVYGRGQVPDGGLKGNYGFIVE